MRKMMAGMAVMAAVFIMSSATALAVEVAELPNNNSVEADISAACAYCGVSCSFVDADGNGICDNYGTYGCGMGAGYVDADGDGVCDNYGTYGCGRGRGGRGYGRGRCWR